MKKYWKIFVSLTLNFRYILSMLKENSVTFVTSHFFCLIDEYFCNSPNKLPSKKRRFFWNLWLIVISTQECVQYGHCPQVNDEKNEIFHSFSIRLIWSPTYYCVEIFILIFLSGQVCQFDDKFCESFEIHSFAGATRIKQWTDNRTQTFSEITNRFWFLFDRISLSNGRSEWSELKWKTSINKFILSNIWTT